MYYGYGEGSGKKDLERLEGVVVVGVVVGCGREKGGEGGGCCCWRW